MTGETTLGPFDVQVGDCVLDAGQLFVSEVVAVPCTDRHTSEAYFRHEITTETYEETAIEAEVTTACRNAFDEFVGIPIDASELDVYFHAPEVSTFLGGQRTAICYVWDALSQASDDDLIQSLRGADR